MSLVDRWRHLKLDEKLQQAASRGVVLAGGSAGAICWFDAGHSDSMDPASYRPDLSDEKRAATSQWEYIRVPCLGLLPGLVCPHHDRTQSNGVLRATVGSPCETWTRRQRWKQRNDLQIVCRTLTRCCFAILKSVVCAWTTGRPWSCATDAIGFSLCPANRSRTRALMLVAGADGTGATGLGTQREVQRGR